MDKVEISLHNTILAWLTMDGDVSIIEVYMFAIKFEREIVFINFHNLAIVEIYMPVCTFDIYDVDIIAFMVEEGIKSLCRPQRYIMF